MGAIVADTVVRRGFLQLLVVAAGGSLITSPFPAEATGINGVERYTIALDKAATVVRMAEAARPAGSRFNLATTQITAAIDDLLSYLLASFPQQPDMTAVRQMIETRRVDFASLSEADLERLSDGLIPLAILRELVRHHNVAFDTMACPAYTRFVQRYSAGILDG